MATTTTTNQPKDRKDLTFADGDFTSPPPPRETASCIVSGEQGSGKTTLGLMHAPGPICYMDIDRGGLWAVERALAAGKHIRYLSLEYPHNYSALDEAAAKKLAQVEVDKLTKNHEIAIREAERGNVRTIVWDTGTEIAELINIALAGRPERKSDDFGATPNAQKVVLKNMVDLVQKGTSANIIILSRAKEIYAIPPGGKRKEGTGDFTARVPEGLLYEVDWYGHIKVTKRKIASKGTFAHELKMMKSRVNFAVLGEVYKEEDWDVNDVGPFAYACMWHYELPPDTWM